MNGAENVIFWIVFSFYALTLLGALGLKIFHVIKITPVLAVIALPLAWTVFLALAVTFSQPDPIAMIGGIAIAGLIWLIALPVTWWAIASQINWTTHAPQHERPSKPGGFTPGLRP